MVASVLKFLKLDCTLIDIDDVVAMRHAVVESSVLISTTWGFLMSA